MQIAYIILVHQNPAQLLRLVRKLNTSDSKFVIHIDKRKKLSEFKSVFAGMGFGNLHFIRNRCYSTWGGYQIVQATLNALKFIYKNLPSTERVVLLSGQDYPIKSNKYIHSYLAMNPSKIYMQYFKVPHYRWHIGGLKRFPYFRKIDQVIKIYGGSQWMSFPFDVIKVIFEFLEYNPDFTTYFKAVQIPDESFFQTLFLNCEIDIISENLVNKNLHLIKWAFPYLHPRILTEKDYNIIKKCKSLFARKFDSELSINILNRIDDELLSFPCRETMV